MGQDAMGSVEELMQAVGRTLAEVLKQWPNRFHFQFQGPDLFVALAGPHRFPEVRSGDARNVAATVEGAGTQDMVTQWHRDVKAEFADDARDRLDAVEFASFEAAQHRDVKAGLA